MLAISSRAVFLAGFSLLSLWAADALAWRGARCYYHYPYGYYAQPTPLAVPLPQPHQTPSAPAARGSSDPGPQANTASPYTTYYRASTSGDSAAPYGTYYVTPDNGNCYYGREPGQIMTSGSQSGVSEPVTDQPTAPLIYPR
jgi:hypothetical protein